MERGSEVLGAGRVSVDDQQTVKNTVPEFYLKSGQIRASGGRGKDLYGFTQPCFGPSGLDEL